MLKNQVVELRELNINNQSRNKELEQYGRCLCLRIDGVPTVKNGSSDDVLEFTKSLFKEAKVAVPDNVLDRAHRIGSSYNQYKQTEEPVKNAKASLWHLLHFDTGLYSTGQEKI